MHLKLPHHSISFIPEEELVVTTFRDGSFAHACPHHDERYREHARDKAGSDDVMLYCWQHDVMHALLAEVFLRGPSPTLWALAHGEPADTPEVHAEEHFVQEFQRAMFMRAGAEPGEYPVEPALLTRR